MDIIPIHASIVPFERVFSSGKETMTPCQRRISPAFMEKLQMLKFSIQKEKALNCTNGLLWVEEWKELEQIQRYEVPSDMFAYLRSLQVHDDDGDLDWEDEDLNDNDGGDPTQVWIPEVGDEEQYDDDEDDAAGGFLDIYVCDSEPDDDDDEGLYM